MSRVFFTSDWHIGHKAILKYRTGFTSVQEHDKLIFDNYKALITKRDTVYFLGDICFDKERLHEIKELQGHKILIMGNHDDYIDTKLLVETFDKVLSLKNHKGFWLSHAPIHPDELRGKWNIHGHTHHYDIPDIRYINVCVEKTNFTPVNFEVLKKLKLDVIGEQKETDDL